MRWTSDLDTAINLYSAEKYEECIAHIKTVFRDTIPNNARVRYHSLLAYCLEDWYEAEDARFYAESTYTSWCLFNPNGSYPGVERIREELRDDLDKLAEYLKTFGPDDWKETQRFWNNAEATEAQAEYAVEFREAEEEEDGVVIQEEEQEDEEANAVAVKEEEQKEENVGTPDRENEEKDGAAWGEENEDSVDVERKMDVQGHC